MKKLVSVLLFALCMMCAVAALAETSGDYEYAVLEDGTAQITKYNGKASELTIPAVLDGHAVTSIGYKAFYWRSSLTSVTIPDSVTSIGDYAFASCKILTSVTIPDSVTSIGANPFVECGSLTKVTVSPEHPTLATIDGVLFSKTDKRLVWYPMTSSASSYSIPQGIIIIGDYAFGWCSSLTSVTIPDSVISIGDYAFYDCFRLTSVTIPDSVISIGDYAFYRCESLTSVMIPDSVTSIADYTFWYCSSLTSVTIPASVTSIGENAFHYDKDGSDIPLNLTMTVERGSYAEEYCKDNNINYTYPDSLDWLNN